MCCTTLAQSVVDFLSLTDLRLVIDSTVMHLCQVAELQEMSVGPTLLEALQAENPSAADAVKQILSAVASVAVCGESSKFTGSPSQSSSSNGCDGAKVSGAGSATGHITDLGIVGRGVKRAAVVSVASSSCQVATSDSSQPVAKKRSLEDMMNAGRSVQPHRSSEQRESVQMAGSSARGNDAATVVRSLLANSTASLSFTPESSSTSATDIAAIPASPATSFQS